MGKERVGRRDILTLGGFAAAALVAAQPAMGDEIPNSRTTPEGKTDPEPSPKIILPEMLPEAESLLDEFPVKVPIEPKPESFARNEVEQAEWKKLTESLDKNFSIAKGSTILGSLAAHAMRIEAGAKCDSAPDCQYHALHVEPLLDQAADLLDRCLRDRNSYEEIAATYLTQLLELFEYADLDKIHADEEKAGIYKVDSSVSGSEWVAEQFLTNGQYRIGRFNQSVFDSLFSGGKFGELVGAEQLTSWLTGLVHYSYQGQRFDRYNEATWNGAKKPIYMHYYDAGVTRSNHNAIAEFYDFRTKIQQFLLEADVNSRRLPGREAKSDWDALNVSFQVRRTKVARKYQDIRFKATVSHDGVLNRAKRLEALRERFRKDFRDAFSKLLKAEEGLKEVYGYIDPLPRSFDSLDHYDECLLWTRDAIQWIVRFSRREQSMVMPISLKDVIGNSAWKEGKKTGQWTFTLRSSDFPDLYFLRLRGIGAYVDDKCGYHGRLWRIRLELPSKGVFYRGTYDSKDTGTLDQSDLPSARLGRVTQRDYPRDGDVVGTSSLHNASPLGDWKVTLLGAIPSVDDARGLEDIVIDLHLAFMQPNSCVFKSKESM